MAKKLGTVTGKAVWSWESDRTEPNMGQIEALSIIFGIKKSDLIEDHPTAADLPDVISIDAGQILMDDLTDEQKEEVKRYVEWIKDRDKKGN